jgi:S-disulfanyl-L-cysteine oxidoreductase SoxD
MSSSASRRLVRATLAVAGSLVAAAASAQFATPRYGFGRAPTTAEIAAWDIDVRPDGHGVKKGRGTVQQGQAIYDAQCASCHGTFGESNSYMVIAGGVEPEDVKVGRAARLRDATAVRTVGNKLNHASTLWDYINRAMPWTNPQSLSVDEVYAVTAYVLNLNAIVPEDFELDERNLLTLPMPNRNGLTRAHGMGAPLGKPDVQGSQCMKDCAREVKIASALPDHARGAHGDIAQQMRAFGPYRGVTTDATPAAMAAAKPAPRELVAQFGCVACHAPDRRIVGPGFAEIAAKYAQRSDAGRYLAGRIRSGGQGVWGPVPMPPQGLKEEDAAQLAQWILAGSP